MLTRGTHGTLDLWELFSAACGSCVQVLYELLPYDEAAALLKERNKPWAVIRKMTCLAKDCGAAVPAHVRRQLELYISGRAPLCNLVFIKGRLPGVTPQHEIIFSQVPFPVVNGAIGLVAYMLSPPQRFADRQAANCLCRACGDHGSL